MNAPEPVQILTSSLLLLKPISHIASAQRSSQYWWKHNTSASIFKVSELESSATIVGILNYWALHSFTFLRDIYFIFNFYPYLDVRPVPCRHRSYLFIFGFIAVPISRWIWQVSLKYRHGLLLFLFSGLLPVVQIHIWRESRQEL